MNEECYVVSLRKEKNTRLLTHEEAALVELFLKQAQQGDLFDLLEQHGEAVGALFAEAPYQEEAFDYFLGQDEHPPEVIAEKILTLAPDKRNDVMTALQQLHQRGEEQGRKEERRELAKMMLLDGEPLAKISKYTGITHSWLGQLKREVEGE